MTKVIFTGDEVIHEIIGRMPEAQEILFAHGLGCAGCSVGAYESLRDGAANHGFSEDEIELVIDDLNEAAKDIFAE